jgi:hypothetical protein
MPPVLWNEEETFVGLFGLLALGVALYWLVARGPRRRASVPASVEDRIDHVVETLNERYGKDWGDMEVGALEAAMHGVLPAPLLPLLDVVHLVEEHAAQWGLSSTTKRWWAAHQVSRAALA